MTPWQALVLVAAMTLFFAAFAAVGAIPVSGVFIAAGIMGAAAAIALVLRRWLDRSVANSLSTAGTPGGESARFKVSSYRPYRSWGAIGTVTTTVAGVAGRFEVHDAKQRWGLRLLKRLGLGRRLAVSDDEFNQEIYVEGNAELASKLFASAERREAARAIFRMGFFAIECRHDLLLAFRHGTVPDDVAVHAGPLLLLLARSADPSAPASSMRVRSQ